MNPPAALLRVLSADLKVACLFYTRLPLPHGAAVAGADVARAGWAAPVVGAIVGLVGAAIYWLAHVAGLPALIGAALAIGATLALTGGLHEDGLADLADGLGGATREQKLEIMRDARIGIYGACALGLSLLLRAGALASIGEPVPVASALVAAHAAARATVPAFMRLVPPARRDGLSAGAGAPPLQSAVAAGLLGIVALVLGLGVAKSAVAVLAIVLLSASIAGLCLKQIGGQTGDVLGALEQVNEIAILLVASARV